METWRIKKWKKEVCGVIWKKKTNYHTLYKLQQTVFENKFKTYLLWYPTAFVNNVTSWNYNNKVTSIVLYFLLALYNTARKLKLHWYILKLQDIEVQLYTEKPLVLMAEPTESHVISCYVLLTGFTCHSLLSGHCYSD